MLCALAVQEKFICLIVFQRHILLFYISILNKSHFAKIGGLLRNNFAYLKRYTRLYNPIILMKKKSSIQICKWTMGKSQINILENYQINVCKKWHQYITERLKRFLFLNYHQFKSYCIARWDIPHIFPSWIGWQAYLNRESKCSFLQKKNGCSVWKFSKFAASVFFVYFCTRNQKEHVKQLNLEDTIMLHLTSGAMAYIVIKGTQELVKYIKERSQKKQRILIYNRDISKTANTQKSIRICQEFKRFVKH